MIVTPESSSAAVLVVAECRSGQPTALTFELLGLARTLTEKTGGGVAAVVIGSEEAAAALAQRGVKRVYWCGSESDEYESEPWVDTVEWLARDLEPHAILCGHTPSGADLAPRLAFRLETGVATGCVEITSDPGKLLFTRACFGGNVRETVSFTAKPALATVKPGVGVAAAETTSRGAVITLESPSKKRRTRVLGRHRESAERARLEDAKVIVAGGRGLQGPEGFRVLENLAAVLDGAVGSSRVPCDLGWCPHGWQIGLTGKTVTPDLYFAVGISGAGHHLAGCGNAKTIVAINTDPGAAIFKEARFGIVGDYRKVVPALATALKALKHGA